MTKTVAVAAFIIMLFADTPTNRPGNFHDDVMLDTSQVEVGNPLPECGSPEDRIDIACTVTSDGVTIIAETDGTTFIIPRG